MVSFEDYRNGYYYNTYNKYTIVNIVPNSCCIFREQLSQLTQCQMKSVNIYRKGCYEILMWWMESFGSIISGLTLIIGLLYLLAALISGIIVDRLKKLRVVLRQKAYDKKNRLADKKLSSSSINYIEKDVGDSCGGYGKNRLRNDYYFDTTTLEETMSYVETKT